MLRHSARGRSSRSTSLRGALATKQSSFFAAPKLDCFAALAMTAGTLGIVLKIDGHFSEPSAAASQGRTHDFVASNRVEPPAYKATANGSVHLPSA